MTYQPQTLTEFYDQILRDEIRRELEEEYGIYPPPVSDRLRTLLLGIFLGAASATVWIEVIRFVAF